MKLIQDNRELIYSPYKLYQHAVKYNNYEQVIVGFIANWKDKTSENINGA